MASPMMYTRAWSATVAGFVMKKKPSVMWKRETDVMMVRAEMSAMVTAIRYSFGVFDVFQLVLSQAFPKSVSFGEEKKSRRRDAVFQRTIYRWS
jgi:hypothetical protein